MSDYELAYLFTTITDRGSTVFMDYVTILFAFLVAGFFVADQLSRKMVWVVIGSYIFAQVFVLLTLNSIEGAITEMNNRRLQGSETFSWYVHLEGLASMMGWMLVLIEFLMSLIVAASVWFFFERRRYVLS